jgi:hypothetical protein
MLVTEAKVLRQTFWPEFVEHEGGLFLSQALPIPHPSLAIYPDLTAAEVFYNHVHILDEFAHNASLDGSDPNRGYWDKTHPDFLAACDVGKWLAEMWHAKLKLEYPDRRTRVYFTSDDNPIVRFHCVRPDQFFWLEEARWLSEINAGRIIVFDSDASASRGAA